MDNMHVLIMPSWYFQKGTAQLRGIMFHRHAHAMRKKGIDARILYGEFNPSQSLKEQIIFSTEDTIPTWRVTQWFPPKVNAYVTKLWVKKYVLAVEDYIAKEGKPDIIHAQSYLTGAVAATLKEKFKIPFVYTERLSSVLSGQIPVRYAPLLRMALDHSELNTAVSPGLQKKLQSFTQKSIEVVPNFYDPEIFYVDPTVKKYKIFSWVTVGEPADIKGLDILLEAYGQLRGRIGIQKMQLFLVDDIREKRSLMKIVNKYNMTDEIHWAGLLTQTGLAKILRSCHVYISSSRVETFGKSIVEAMACGLPVIATKTEGANYILNRLNGNKLVEINDPVSLSAAMEHLMKSNNLLSTHSETQSVASRFSEDVVIDQWLALYKQSVR